MQHPTVAIVTDVSDRFVEWKYLLRLFVRAWEARGIKVVVVRNEASYQPADIAFLHADLTVVSESCLALCRRYPHVVNGGSINIHKRYFSDLLVTPQTDWKGPVIVKTVWNCGGWREFREWLEKTLLGRFLQHFGGFETYHNFRARQEAKRPWRDKRLLPYGQYPIFASRAEIPDGVWQNENMVVEKFISEKEGNEYYCRHWVFLGDREVTFRSYSLDPVVKLNGRLEQTNDLVPHDLREIRQSLGFDYGKFDYCVVNGKTVLYDVNRTPAAAVEARYEWAIPRLERGLDIFLPRRQGEPALA
ncbi:MAG TPA: hypothetical protein VIM69_14235 [Opitutaceae bacterium]